MKSFFRVYIGIIEDYMIGLCRDDLGLYTGSKVQRASNEEDAKTAQTSARAIHRCLGGLMGTGNFWIYSCPISPKHIRRIRVWG